MTTKIFKPCCPKDYSEIAEILKNGGIVAIPSETVYGLAGNALDDSCVEKIAEKLGGAR